MDELGLEGIEIIPRQSGRRLDTVDGLREGFDLAVARALRADARSCRANSAVLPRGRRGGRSQD